MSPAPREIALLTPEATPVLDDEPLALNRLQRILGETGRVEIVGASTASFTAVDEIRRLQPDVLFLDIEMPGLTGFDVLERLGTPQPLVIFTTAYDQYALEAFKVNSIDYLVKPIERADLARALAKLERVFRRAPNDRRSQICCLSRSDAGTRSSHGLRRRRRWPANTASSRNASRAEEFDRVTLPRSAARQFL